MGVNKLKEKLGLMLLNYRESSSQAAYFQNIKRLFLFSPFKSCFWGPSATVRPALPSSLGEASSGCPQKLAQLTAGGSPPCWRTTLHEEDAPLKWELFPLESAATTGLHSIVEHQRNSSLLLEIISTSFQRGLSLIQDFSSKQLSSGHPSPCREKYRPSQWWNQRSC